MYDLYRKSDNRYLGQVSEADLQFLRDNLEEETLTDDDYTITRMTLEFLRGNGLPTSLADVLAAALGNEDEVEIVYRAKEAGA